MKSKYFVKICVALGFFIYFIAWMLKFFMTMDIPISLHNVLVIAGTIVFLIQRRRALNDGFDHARA